MFDFNLSNGKFFTSKNFDSLASYFFFITVFTSVFYIMYPTEHLYSVLSGVALIFSLLFLTSARIIEASERRGKR